MAILATLNTLTSHLPPPILLALPTQILLSTIHEVHTISFLIIYTLTNTSLLLHQLILNTVPVSLLSTLLDLVKTNVLFLSTLAVLTVIRRVYFHPLSRFPGQKRYAVSKLWEGYTNALGENGIRIRDLHRRYNTSILRVGPNELTVVSVEVLPHLYSRSIPHKSRGPWYNIWKIQGTPNLLTAEDDVHRKWRPLWEQAFSAPAMERFTKRVEEHVERLVEAVGREAGKEEMSIGEVVARFTFDVMADLGFAIPNYGLLSLTGDPGYMNMLHEFMCTTNVMATFRNLMDIALLLPLEKDPKVKKFNLYGRDLLKHRLSIENPPNDVAKAFLESPDTRLTDSEMVGNVQLLIVAGSDTTSTILTVLLYYLSKFPEFQRTLYAEIQSAAPFTTASLGSLPYLNALINETLRLYPAVPSGTQAQTGPNGLTVEGQYIPPKTVVRVNQFAMHTDPRYWEQPDEFLPERWVDRSLGLIKDRRAFLPFSYGRHACVGKQLALQELRLATVKLVEKYKFTPGKSALGVEDYRKAWKDYFTAMPGPNWVKVELRE